MKLLRPDLNLKDLAVKKMTELAVDKKVDLLVSMDNVTHTGTKNSKYVSLRIPHVCYVSRSKRDFLARLKSRSDKEAALVRFIKETYETTRFCV